MPRPLRLDGRPAEMYALYLTGVSVRGVARAFGVSPNVPWAMFVRRGWPLRPRKRLPGLWYNGRRYAPGKDGYYFTSSAPHTALHRDVWGAAHGSIPSGCQVHHKNGNPADCRLQNLALVANCAEHRWLHRGSDCVRQPPGGENLVIECACGCGRKFYQYDRWRRPRLFLHGHNRRGA